MAPTLLVLILVVVAAGFWLLRSGRSAQSPARTSPERKPSPVIAPPDPQPSAAGGSEAPSASLIAPLRDSGTPAAPAPAKLALQPAELLDPLLSDTLMEALRRLPRPPRAVQQLMSPDFMRRASSTELAGVVMAEPAIAARVLATANSPLYGLQQPVTSIGQAITFLGLSSVRQMCLQHMLTDCFQPRDAAQQREFDMLWRASSIAGELCQQLAPRLRIPEPGTLATLLVLSFLGRQAGVALLPDAGLLATLDAHAQALHEQQQLGLASHELGHLLMRAWELPAEFVDEARSLSALRFDPGLTLPPEREAALTLGAVCALLGERIARGQIGTALYDPVNDSRPDMAALRERLAKPPLDGISAELRSPAMLRVVGRLMGGAT